MVVIPISNWIYYKKNNDDSYTPGYTLAMGYFALREI